MTKHIYNDIFVHNTNNSLIGINTMVLTFTPKKSLPPHSSQDIEPNHTACVRFLCRMISSTLLFAKKTLSNDIPKNEQVHSKLQYRKNLENIITTTIRSFKLKYKPLFKRYLV